MKLTIIEAISTIRKKVSLHSLLIILVIILLFIGAVIIRLRRVVSGEFFEGSIIPFLLLLVFALFMVFKRRAAYMNILKPGEPENSIINLEKWIHQEYTSFRSTDMARLIMGSIITIVMLLLLFFKSESYSTGAVFIGFVGLISLSMLKSWSLMRDGINLQDLKHCQRDQTSEIS